jgi:hypothetical protein
VADVLGWLHVFAIKHRRAGRRTRLRP